MGPLGFVRGLEGVRALAIALVIATHYFAVFRGGFIGVDVFFVVSGFLITTLLLEEREAHGRVSMRAFYRRRVVRLGPALLALIVVDVVVRSAVLRTDDLFAASAAAAAPLTFINNWLIVQGASAINEFGPTWSLSVEEQFYLIAPVVLLVLLGRGWSTARIGSRAAVAAALVALWCVVVYRINGDVIRSMFGTDTRSAGLLVGVALACARRTGVTDRVPLGVRSWGGTVALVGLLLFSVVGSGDAYVAGFGAVVVLLAAVLVAAVVDGHDRAIGWCATRRPVLWMGRVSYGLYLWNLLIQVVVLAFWSSAHEWQVAVVAIPLTLVIAQLSFVLVERPIGRWARARAAARSATGSSAVGSSTVGSSTVDDDAIDVVAIDLRQVSVPDRDVSAPGW